MKRQEQIRARRGRRARGRTLALALSFCACAAARARALPAQIELEWDAPERCPGAADVRAGVEARLQQSAAAASASATANAVVRRHAGGFALSLRVRVGETSSQRELSASSCEALADAAALLIAMAIDPSLVPQGPPPSEAAPPPAPMVPARPGARAEATRAPPASSPPALGLGVGGAVLGDAGMMPGFGVGGGLALTLGALRFPVETSLGGQFLVATSTDAGFGSATVSFAAVMAQLQVCSPLFTAGRVALGPCAVGELGTLHGRAGGILRPQGKSSLWLAAGAGAGMLIELSGGLAATVALFAIVPQDRLRFWFDSDTGTHDVHRVSPVLGRLGIGIRQDFH